jgi:hypothetical protein
MPLRTHALIFALASALAGGAANAQTTRKVAPTQMQSTQGLAKVARSCPSMIRGNGASLPDGGHAEYPQGWYFNAEVRDGQRGAFLHCYYGFNNSSPSTSLVYWVDYELAGFKAGQCSLSRNTVTCAR